MKKIIALAATLMATIALASPVQATQPADLDDVLFMTSIGKVVFIDLDLDNQNAICLWFELQPYAARNELARGMYYDVYEGEYSMYDTKRAAWRILNWGC